MRKRVVYAGLLLLVIAIAVLAVSNGEAQNAIKKNISITNVTVLNDSFYAMPLHAINTTYITYVSVDANNALNEYLFNASTFGLWKTAMLGNSSASGIHYARLLDIGNRSLIYTNNAVMSAILQQNSSSAYAYLVVDNTPGSNSSAMKVPVRIMVLPASESMLFPYAAGDVTGVIILLASIVIIIYGLIRKQKAYAQQEGSTATSTKGASDESAYIENLYKSIESKKKSRKGKRADSNG
ncbi:MAG: hypothetical protein ACP5UH_00365 [Candidatus Micrarchaeia archaeon]